MTRIYGTRRDTSLRFRPLFEEDDATRYKREGWDPRKTYEENMTGESLFVEDGSLEEPDFEPAPRRPSRQARQLAAQGRGEDTEIAHVARGELVVPQALQTPEFMAALARAAAAYGVPLERLSVGSVRNSINPETGAPEFFFDGLTKGISDFFARKNAQPSNPVNAPDDFMSGLPSVRDAAKGYDFSNPIDPGNIRTPELPTSTSPWKTIDKDMLTNIIYNEMSSFRGPPQKLEEAAWATANTIMNRQAQGIPEDFKKKTLADPVITEREMHAIRAGNPDAKRAYDMASGVADLITSAPDAFPSQWPHTHYNHRDTPSKADHERWHRPVMVQYGPFDSYQGKQWLNIYGPERRR